MRKADRYWPEQVGGTSTAGEWCITLLDSDAPVCPGWEVVRRRFRLCRRVAVSSAAGRSRKSTAKDLSTHEITQLHIISWPDFGSKGIESYERILSLVQSEQQSLLRTNRSTPPSSSPPPIWIHCSAGVGRTGVLISGLQLLQFLSHSPPPTPTITAPDQRRIHAQELAIKIIEFMRSYRPGMVQGVGQATMLVDLTEAKIEERSESSVQQTITHPTPMTHTNHNGTGTSSAPPPPPSASTSSSVHQQPKPQYPPSTTRHGSLLGRSTSNRGSPLHHNSSSRQPSLKGRSPSLLSSDGGEGTFKGLARSLSRSLTSRRHGKRSEETST